MKMWRLRGSPAALWLGRMVFGGGIMPYSDPEMQKAAKREWAAAQYQARGKKGAVFRKKEAKRKARWYAELTGDALEEHRAKVARANRDYRARKKAELAAAKSASKSKVRKSKVSKSKASRSKRKSKTGSKGKV